MGAPVNDLKAAFNAIATGYDEQRRWIIPDFSGFYAAAVTAAASPMEDPSILDIGAGTGLLAEMLLHAYPALELAEARFQERERIHFVTCDCRRGGLGGPFDVIASALSIHHLERDEKRDLYRRIFRALGDGGVFVNADEVAGETGEMLRRNLESWNDFLLGGPLPREKAEAIMRRRETFDRMEKLSVQLGWLREIGFTDVTVVFENRPFAVFTGRKGG